MTQEQSSVPSDQQPTSAPWMGDKVKAPSVRPSWRPQPGLDREQAIQKAREEEAERFRLEQISAEPHNREIAKMKEELAELKSDVQKLYKLLGGKLV